jgi:hypothetical protein
MVLEGGTEAADERVEAAPGLAERAWAQSQGRAVVAQVLVKRVPVPSSMDGRREREDEGYGLTAEN